MTSIKLAAGWPAYRSSDDCFSGISMYLIGANDMKRIAELGPEAIDKAMLEPASVFASPEDVLGHDELTKQQKIDILWRWQYDAAEQSVALEEGMPGEDNDLLRRIMLALGTLGAPLDIEHTGPTKQHGLPRPAERKNG
jgi:hypothetical protein